MIIGCAKPSQCIESTGVIINKDFEVIVFTASQKSYADVILDYIDPEGTLI